MRIELKLGEIGMRELHRAIDAYLTDWCADRSPPISYSCIENFVKKYRAAVILETTVDPETACSILLLMLFYSQQTNATADIARAVVAPLSYFHKI